jgi:hypothetical protein
MNMKRKLIVTLSLLLFASLSLAEEIVNQPAQNPNASYRLFSTQNLYTFLKLDTRNGKIWQLQWGIDEDYRWIEPINANELVTGRKQGRFTLYPTRNIYNFILVDQETGDTWQVQWGEISSRFIVRI